MYAGRALLVGWIAAGIGFAPGLARADENPPPTKAAPADGQAKDGRPACSPAVRGLRGRLELRQAHVFNGTLILATTLHLQNVSDRGDAMNIPWPKVELKFHVVDAAGREVAKHWGPIDDLQPLPVDLAIPHSGELSFDISHNAYGIPADRLAIIDLGDDCWVLSEKDGPCTLAGTMEIAQGKDEHPKQVWHGRLELPAIAIPTHVEPLDPATAQAVIDRLGAAMIDLEESDQEQSRDGIVVCRRPAGGPLVSQGLRDTQA